MPRRLPLHVAVALLVAYALPAWCADWPMWRFDPSRAASTPEALADQLSLQWSRQFEPQIPAWPNEPRLDFDYSYEPIVAEGTLFLASASHACVYAFDAATGRERWRFYADGPVRLAPVAAEGRVYFGSDDGHLYAVQTATGGLVWKVRGAPDGRADWRHLGNNRLVSFWPVRGGPVLNDGVLYFGSGIWPTLGVFITAVDARTGKVLWQNRDSNLMPNVRLDHNSLFVTALSPQGYFLLHSDLVVAPNGRSMPARFDPATGERLYFVQGYRNGHCRVTAMGDYAFVGNDGVIDLRDGREVGNRWVEAGEDAPMAFDAAKFDLFEGPIDPYKLFPGCNARSVLTLDTVYGMEAGVVYAYDLGHAQKSTYEKKSGDRTLNPGRWDLPLRWELETPFAAAKAPCLALIKAGSRLYGHAGKTLLAIDLPEAGGEPQVAWTEDLDGTPSSLIAADGRLYAFTKEGWLHCFGAGEPRPVTYPLVPTPLPAVNDRWTGVAREMLEQSGSTEGFCLLLQTGSGRLLEELLSQSSLHIIAFEANPGRAKALRDRLVAASVYGSRVDVVCGSPADMQLPPYVATLVTWEEPPTADELLPPERLFSLLRPYGGTACLPLPESVQKTLGEGFRAAGLPNAEVTTGDGFLLLRRKGALPGSAYWTHESADCERTYYSTDKLVTAPLGVLWYGDGEGYGFYKQKDYGIGVKPQVIGGRLFAFQIHSNTLHAIDVYTGRVLWKTQVEPFTRYASLDDGIYVAGRDRCIVYDPATGAPLKTFPYETKEGQTPFVVDVRVSDDTILIAVGFERVRVIEKGMWDATLLVALDRRTGQQLWTQEAQERVNIHSLALGEGMVFCIDSASPIESERWQRRGEVPTTLPSTIMALDARTGERRWEQTVESPFRTYGIGNWLGIRAHDDWAAYCGEPGLLLTGKANELRALEAKTGQEVWHKQIGGGQPLIIQGTTFINQAGHTYDARTGDLLSEAPAFMRSGGCNYAVAGESLIFLRDKSVSYVEKDTGAKHYLCNVRSGCSNSLVAADGLLNVPCFAVGCVCNYPIQTSFAMVHLPEVALWEQPGGAEAGGPGAN